MRLSFLSGDKLKNVSCADLYINDKFELGRSEEEPVTSDVSDKL